MLSVTQTQWDSLIAFAQKGGETADERRVIENLILAIERASGVVRYQLLVRWQDAGAVGPATLTFPRSWPPEHQITMRKLGEPFLKRDVQEAVSVRSTNPVTVMVTEDPGGEYGWATLDQYFSG